MILIQEALLRCFPIDELVMIEPLPLGPFSHGWLAEVKRQGLKGRSITQRWFVKRHRTKSAARLTVELQLADRLRSDGMDLIPQVIPTNDGSLWFQCADGYYSAHMFVEAQPPYDWMQDPLPGMAAARNAGVALADFHHRCANLPAEMISEWQQQAKPFLPELKPALDSGLNRAIEQLQANDPVRQLVLGLADSLRDNLISALGQSMLCACRQIPIHGDYHPGNVLFRNDKVVAVLDFDYVQLGCPGYDIAYSAYMFGRDWKTGTWADSCRENFLWGYRIGSSLHSSNETTSAHLSAASHYRMLPPFLVGYWLLDQYIDQLEMREVVEPVLRTALQDAAAIVGNRLLVVNLGD